MPVVPPLFVEVPQVEALPYGLLSAARVIDSPDPHLGGGIEAYGNPCGPVSAATLPCPPPEPEPDPKTITEFPILSADPLYLYMLVRCRLVGGRMDSARERALEAFQLAEGRGIEAGVMQTLLAVPGVVDLTGPAATDPATGLARLEGYAAANYGGRPVIHASRTISSILGTLGSISRQGTRLETVLGAHVAAGGGYEANFGPGTELDPDPVPAPDGESWMYATGQVTIFRGVADTKGPAITLNPNTNEYLVLTERPAAVVAECFVAAVRVTEEACCP